ncbi:aspartate aminotransferase family protein [Baekduia soli]|uniref:Aspartate aminotransferase family protein n=1 Tax=Baekduia soli TaxID=496014 RepID=A0A5B8U2W1_9ACTN|nr:aminotransferase class III-fold pyridoxal phosphate-dependent enzyme [Baekduia soli]QEC47399.1 aspartate aminotransferase family protein [Baekduia soli]
MSTSAEAPAGRDTRLWHPFADMAAVRGAELVIARGEDVWVWDEEGRRYLDAFGSLWYANIGHGRAEIADAVAAQMRTLEAFTIFFDYANRPALDLADRLADLSPMPGTRVLLGAGGSEAIDSAVKLVRRYWTQVGEPGRTHIITREHAYHGVGGAGTSLSGIPANREGWGPLLSGTSQIDHADPEALEAEIARLGAGAVAAFFCEPVIGAGGVRPPAPGYLERVAEICAQHGVLYVSDEVICGFGRLGTWFGIERWGIVPDLIIFAKGVTSGYLPLGGVLVGERVARPFWEEPGTMVRHGFTFAGHPACCAAALANLDVIEREGLLARGAELEGLLAGALAPLAGHPAVTEVRSGTGAMAALDLAVTPEEPAPGPRLVAAVRAAGVITRATGPATVAVCPPLTATAEHVGLLREALDTGLATLPAAAPGAAAAGRP